MNRREADWPITEAEKKYNECERNSGHMWYDTDEIYEKCLKCGHGRVQVNLDFSAIHVKKRGGDV